MASNGLIEQMVENPGMPIRQPSTAVFTVDTADRYVLNSAGYRIDTAPVNNLYINKQQTVINGYFTRVALTELNMPWNVPNVNARNNTLTVFCQPAGPDPAIEPTVSITEGFYTGTALATALQTALNAAMTAAGAPYNTEFTFTVSFSTTTGKFTITNTAGLPFLITPKNNANRDDLLNMMGFGGLRPAAAPYTQYVSGVASMLYTPYFDIVSKQLTKKQQVGDAGTSYSTGQNLLARIYLTKNDLTITDFTNQLGTSPFTIHREFRVPKQIYWDTKEFINTVDLTLIDYKGNVLYESTDKSSIIPDGERFTAGSGSSNWQLTMQVSEV